MAYPRLMLQLERRNPVSRTALGVHDLFLPAVISAADGSFPEWRLRLPPGFELSRRVSHECREAAWDGELCVSGDGEWHRRFLDALSGRDPAQVADDYRVLEAAVAVRAAARRLHAAVTSASVAERDGPAVHPLSPTDRPDGEVPFGFAVSLAPWKGVLAKTYLDFAVGIGSPDAEAFLATVVASPSRWFNEMEELEAALVRLARDRDVAAFRKAVGDWNDRQDIALGVPDRGVIVPAIWADGDAAAGWSGDFSASAEALVEAVLRDRWSWWTPPGDAAGERGEIGR